jgi:hypothetical protein
VFRHPHSRDRHSRDVTTFQPGDICWDVMPELGAVLVTEVLGERDLPGRRRLETYRGIAFRAGRAPDSVDEFAIVVAGHSVA